MKSKNPVINYYHTWESKLGYRWLHGVKHFGYYPEGQENISKLEAQLLMNDQLANALSLAKDSKVLDAGCGEGGVAIYLQQKHGLQTEGIDLLDFNIKRAKAAAKSAQIDPQKFQVGTYMKLPYENNTFDGLYTMETLVHAPNYAQALSEFHRVLRPGGKLALFEYSITPEKDVTADQKEALKAIRRINKVSSMPAFNEFEHGTFEKKLTLAGFRDVTEKDITARMLPMLKLFYKKAKVPYAIIKRFGLQDHFINTMSAVELHENLSLFKYNIVTATNK
jgi:sterol 24-C-methyltransferase